MWNVKGLLVGWKLLRCSPKTLPCETENGHTLAVGIVGFLAWSKTGTLKVQMSHSLMKSTYVMLCLRWRQTWRSWRLWTKEQHPKCTRREVSREEEACVRSTWLSDRNSVRLWQEGKHLMLARYYQKTLWSKSSPFFREGKEGALLAL